MDALDNFMRPIIGPTWYRQLYYLGFGVIILAILGWGIWHGWKVDQLKHETLVSD